MFSLQEIYVQKKMQEMVQNDQKVHKKGSLLCLTVVALIVAVVVGVYLSEFQLISSMCKQQFDKLAQQNVQLQDDYN